VKAGKPEEKEEYNLFEEEELNIYPALFTYFPY